MADSAISDRELLERYLDAHQRHIEDVSHYVQMGRGSGLEPLRPITREVVQRWQDRAREEEEALRAWHDALSRYTMEVIDQAR